jgi:hypothetical protein
VSNHLKFLTTGLCLSLALVSCPKPPDPNPPTANITNPAQDSVLTGTAAIQIDARDDETSVARVNVYARGKDSTKKGTLIGSSITKPYVVSWNTTSATGVPNQLPLELIAEAVDRAGNVGSSTPVRVRTQNTGVPNLSLLAAFTYPPAANAAGASLRSANRSLLPAPMSSVTPPPELSQAARDAIRAARVQPQAAIGDRVFAQQWEWSPVLGADGYGIYSSSEELAGPYTRVRNQATDTGNALQIFQRFVDSVKVGDSLYGAVTTLTSAATVESGKSNADAAKFLPAQDSGAPFDGAVIADGQPNLSWTATAGVIGYQYFIYDGNPFGTTKPKIMCTNFPKTTAALSVVYPIPALNGATKCNPLPAGTYYWLVVGVSFDQLDKADGFTYSAAQRFTVP